MRMMDSKKYLDPGIDALRHAIVLQAIKDHTMARESLRRYRNRSDTHMLMECERFFRSDWFGILMPEYDGELMLRTLNSTSIARIKAHFHYKGGEKE
jgi:hypothetical protein